MIARVLTGLLVLVGIRYAILLLMAVTNPPWSAVGFMSLAFVALLVLSALGLFRGQRWGFYAAYALVVFATVFHGIPVIPFVVDLLPEGGVRLTEVIVLNLTFAAATAIAHWQTAQRPGSAATVQGSTS